jgi:hypothetical protein
LFLLLYERISEVKINKLQSYANAICNWQEKVRDYTVCMKVVSKLTVLLN